MTKYYDLSGHCHLWTAPFLQEFFVVPIFLPAVICPAFCCGAFDRWP